jgi:hypothetical protein
MVHYTHRSRRGDDSWEKGAEAVPRYRLKRAHQGQSAILPSDHCPLMPKHKPAEVHVRTFSPFPLGALNAAARNAAFREAGREPRRRAQSAPSVE